MKKFMLVLFIIMVVVLILLFPFATIWALNTLFALGIPYTFWTWLAMLIVNSVVYGAKK
jgi:hypothetical protein